MEQLCCQRGGQNTFRRPLEPGNLHDVPAPAVAEEGVTSFAQAEVAVREQSSSAESIVPFTMSRYIITGPRSLWGLCCASRAASAVMQFEA